MAFQHMRKEVPCGIDAVLFLVEGDGVGQSTFLPFVGVGSEGRKEGVKTGK